MELNHDLLAQLPYRINPQLSSLLGTERRSNVVQKLGTNSLAEESIDPLDFELLSAVHRRAFLEVSQELFDDPRALINRLDRLLKTGALAVQAILEYADSPSTPSGPPYEKINTLTIWQKSFLDTMFAEQQRLNLPVTWSQRGTTLFGSVGLMNREDLRGHRIGTRWFAVSGGCVVVFGDWVGSVEDPVIRFGDRANRILSSAYYRFSNTDDGTASCAISVAKRITESTISSLTFDPYQVRVLEPFTHWETRSFIDIWSE